MADVVEIILALRNVRQFVSQSGQASKAIGGVGTAAEESGKKGGKGWKQIGKWAGGAAAIYGATKFVKGSISATGDLAKSTMTLQRATGMDSKTASEWATVTKARGLGTKQFQVGLVKLSKTMEAARGGNEKANDQLAKMGVNQDMIAKGDVSGALTRSADAFAGMKNPAEKAATAAALFGKSGQALVPMLSAGSAGLQEQLDMADKYGATLDDKAVGSSKDLIAQQREMGIAMEGVKIQLGTALLPVILSVAQALVGFARMFAPLTKNATVMKIALGLLTAAFLAYKIAVVWSTISTLALNTAWLASPITWIILGIVALVAAFYLLYTKVGWFRRAVQNTWNWIKSNWPLLLAIITGPIGIAVALVIKNFDKIKGAVTSVIAWIKRIPGAVGDIAGKVASKAAGIGRAIIRGITGAFKAAGGVAADIGRSIADWINAHTIFGDKVKVGPVKFTMPALAAGGTMLGAGPALVGERGPEVVSLPRGATVTPINQASAIPTGGAFGAAQITTQVVLDRRVLAQAVGHYTADKLARR